VGGDGILILITGTDVSSITTSLKHFFRKFHVNGSAVAGRSSSVPSLFVSAAVAEKVVGCILLSCVADNHVCSPRDDTRPRALSARRFDSLDTAVSDTVVIILRCVMRVHSVESVMSVCVCVCVCSGVSSRHVLAGRTDAMQTVSAGHVPGRLRSNAVSGVWAGHHDHPRRSHRLPPLRRQRSVTHINAAAAAAAAAIAGDSSVIVRFVE